MRQSLSFLLLNYWRTATFFKIAFLSQCFLLLNLTYTNNFLSYCRLSYLHSNKIVHRDVKTENMLLDRTRTLKIADFGVARIEAQNPNDMTGETGTLGYMAPEVSSSYFEIFS